MVRTRAALAAAAIVVVATPVAWMIAQEREAEAPAPTPTQPAKTPTTMQADIKAETEGNDRAKAEAERAASEMRHRAETARQAEASVKPEARPSTPPAEGPQPTRAAKAKEPQLAQSLARPAPATRSLSAEGGPHAVPPPPMPAPLAMRSAEIAPAEPEPVGRDHFEGKPQSGFKTVQEAPVSTFSIDVDTASYSLVRASLARNTLPPPAAVRTEELINYFPYAYEAPKRADEPFKVTASVFPSPWAEGRKIVRVGIKGYELAPASRPHANLVFLVDTSGSMSGPNRLPLVKQSLALLLSSLGADDRVAIVAYAGQAGTVLEPTQASERQKILSAIEGLQAGGGTAGGDGLRQAYALAARNYDEKAVNRVMLATDGDFNIGIIDREALKGFVEREREKGIFLSVLGFGMGNHNDALMQALAQNGNGAAAYIDTLNEARKALVEEASATLFPIAKDVKIQVEFNPASVAEYRLIGYETRALDRDDFENDKVDAGEVGSGQSATALYEIVPTGGPRTVAALRYGETKPSPTSATSEYAFVKLRYKLPKEETSRLIETPVGPAQERRTFAEADEDARFATAVTGFGEILRGGRWTGRYTLDDVLRVASGARGEDAYGYRSEFLQLVRSAKTAQALQSSRP